MRTIFSFRDFHIYRGNPDSYQESQRNPDGKEIQFNPLCKIVVFVCGVVKNQTDLAEIVVELKPLAVLKG